MQVRSRSRLVVPFALAFALGALITGQARAQVSGYALKSAKITTYNGTAQSSGYGYFGNVWIPGTIVSEPSLMNVDKGHGQVIGSLMRTKVYVYYPSGSGSIQTQASANVTLVIKITSPARPTSVSFTMGTFGIEYGSCYASYGGTTLLNLLTQHGGATGGASANPTQSYASSDVGGSNHSEGPELSSTSDCYYDNDGDYVFEVNLVNTVQAGAQGNKPGDNSSSLYVYGQADCCVYLKKVDGQTWATGSIELFEEANGQGIGSYP